MKRRSKNGANPETGEPSARWWRSIEPADLAPLASALSLIVILGGAVYGLERVRGHVLALPEFNPPVELKLHDPPEWVQTEGWSPRILSSIHVPDPGAPGDQADGHLLPDIAHQLAESGWVSSVDQVVRGLDGTVRIACEYRRPIAMILVDLEGQTKFIPIDRDGVRLPEIYDRVDPGAGWLRIIGVETPPPEVGQAYAGDDAVEAVRLAALLGEQEDIAPHIADVDVRNFLGRRDKRRPHILLWPRQGTEPFIWGSAIGQEIEEADAADKLRNLAVSLRRASPQAAVDLSVFSNAWIEQTPEAVRTADGSSARVP